LDNGRHGPHCAPRRKCKSDTLEVHCRLEALRSVHRQRYHGPKALQNNNKQQTVASAQSNCAESVTRSAQVRRIARYPTALTGMTGMCTSHSESIRKAPSVVTRERATCRRALTDSCKHAPPEHAYARRFGAQVPEGLVGGTLWNCILSASAISFTACAPHHGGLSSDARTNRARTLHRSTTMLCEMARHARQGRAFLTPVQS
jgi:hypothetical protein